MKNENQDDDNDEDGDQIMEAMSTQSLVIDTSLQSMVR